MLKIFKFLTKYIFKFEKLVNYDISKCWFPSVSKENKNNNKQRPLWLIWLSVGSNLGR